MSRNKYPETTVKLILDVALELFIEKGYDNTSIQDIVNNLGGLSKGAVYHHFKSKEEIFEEVCKKIGNDNAVYYDKVRDDTTKTGYEKLEIMIKSAYLNPNNDAMVAMMSKILSDPKFFINQVLEIYELIVPKYVQPILEQGIKDGSIQTDYPKELAEVIITLLNIWINPIIAKATLKEIRSKMEFFALLLDGIGINLLSKEIIEEYVTICERYNQC